MKKVVPFKEIILKKTEAEVIDILSSLVEDHDQPVRVKKTELRVILGEFLNYYEKKGILYAYYEMMVGHMEDIAITAIEEEPDVVDLSYILKELRFLELIDSPMEVIPPETKKVIEEIMQKLGKGPKKYERKRR